MKVEVLYIPGCPNCQPTVTRMQKVLTLESVNVAIHEVPVSTEIQAKAFQFPGSPTVRINGKDVEPGSTNTPSLSCRLYANRSGVPSEELLRLAVSEAKRKE